MRIEDTLAFMLGEWVLERTLEDHRSGAVGAFNGTAKLTPAAIAGAYAHYAEAGEMRYGAYAGPAFRSLEFEHMKIGAVLLRFSDGRPYVNLDLRSGTWAAAHDCGPDRYQIETRVRSATVVEERWRVRGPAKDYTAVTTLTRMG
jgi:Family of unknown function (DUF6314)